MNLDKLLEENKYLYDIYVGLDTRDDSSDELDEFNAGYMAGYRGALQAAFEGYLELLLDIKNGAK